MSIKDANQNALILKQKNRGIVRSSLIFCTHLKHNCQKS
jgi:hypothetical protein